MDMELGEDIVTAICAGMGVEAPRLEWTRRVQISGFVIDSRQAKPGSTFVALRGARHDGHDYILAAVAQGAVAVIAERAPAGFPGPILDLARPTGCPQPIDAPTCLVVPDSLTALQAAARAWRSRHTVRVAAVTGSVGKTTCKELTAAVLARKYRTLRSQGNYNNEIGLPLTLLQLEPQHERLVVEMGMYALGEIRLLAELAMPDIGVVTNVGHSHLERLLTIERIAQAKAELPQALPPAERGGVAILNADDERVLAMTHLTKARVFTYGLSPLADLWADEIESEGLEGIRFRFHHGGEALQVHLPMLGRHSVHAALAAAAVGLVDGMDWPDVVTGLTEQSAQLRIEVVSGPAGSTIIEDVYNSSPASALAALNLLGDLIGRKIAVLGGMHELGSFTHDGHKLVGRRAREVSDLLVTVGALGRVIGEEAIRSGMGRAAVHMVETNAEAATALRAIAERGDMILVKGSRTLHMEEIVAAIATQDEVGSLPGGAKER